MTRAREIALEIFHRSNQGGSFANILLPKALAKADIERRDKAFITELVYGALRKRGAVDFALSSFSTRPLSNIPPLALDALRLGAYQVLYMGVPDRAAVHETVEAVKGRFHRGIVSFVNALLRKLSAEKEEIPWPRMEEDPIAYLTVVESHPEWLVQMWVSELSVAVTSQVCRADNETPRPAVRANLLKTSAESLKTALEKRGWRVEAGKYAPEALIPRDGGELSATPEFKAGLFYIQDESSMLAVRALAPSPGTTVMDLCSGPGGKTTYLGELMKNEGLIISVDLSQKRLSLVEKACRRMGLTIPAFVLGDATKLSDFMREPVDAILLDAPCSGLGVLASRPDARWAKSPQQIEELAQLQEGMLDSAADLVRSGGTLVYSVCTISKREGPEQIGRFLWRRPDFRAEGLGRTMPEELKPDVQGSTIQLLPGRHSTNGMFIARMVKISRR
ncbi:MAG: 16S rRNA (cytosine(967)-C(5))-methyltransferase RsmB [Actinobacteria bacterium]|nr:16S rRNA (cytosine(967)-C(5))-methyltransferase RsmB [Actinomycetota bacterium]